MGGRHLAKDQHIPLRSHPREDRSETTAPAVPKGRKRREGPASEVSVAGRSSGQDPDGPCSHLCGQGPPRVALALGPPWPQAPRREEGAALTTSASGARARPSSCRAPTAQPPAVTPAAATLPLGGGGGGGGGLFSSTV